MRPQQQPAASLAAGERFQRGLFFVFAAVAAVTLLAHVGSALWAQNELTQVESVIALQLRMLDAGEPLYRDTNRYPFTISPYGPLYYQTALKALQAGLPGYLSQRLLAIVALAATILLAGRVAWLLTRDKRAAATAGLLVGSSGLLQRWGTTGQSDMPALAFSILAFERFCAWRESGRGLQLAHSGAAIALAIFFKQSFVAAGAAIVILAIAADRRTGLKLAALLSAGGVAIAAALELATGGGFLDHALRSHDNGFGWDKLADHLRYFALTAAPLAIVAAAALLQLGRRALGPAHLYFALAVAVFLLTAPKYGSDLNYQLESFVLLSIVAACALSHLDFFRLRAAGDRGWVTLLEIPLLFYLALNAALAGRGLLTRVVREVDWREQSRRLEPYLEQQRGRVLSVELNPLVPARGEIEVEPLIYTLLVNAGRIDGEAVRQDLEAGRFGTVILYEDLTQEPRPARSPELPTLPAPHLRAVRERYRLIEHVPGPMVGGVYVYEPRREPNASAAAAGL